MPSLEAAGIDTVAVSPLQDNDLAQMTKPSGFNYGFVCDDLENEQLSDVIAAWSMLPPNIQEAILLLVRVHGG